MTTKNQQNLEWAHPLIREWFLNKFGSPTEPQKMGWPAILEEKTTLISAPTGSGKTFAAFLTCINKLVIQALNGALEDKTEVLYISPLKALSNDIQKNLLAPLSEITKLAKAQHLPMQEITVAVRTGDTLSRERQAMLKKPPHILITTPESLYILLTAEKSREMLKPVKTVIVDEIHAMVNDKRGAHLALSLERLEALTDKSFVRIGLSATQKPLETVAHFLAGNNRKIPTIINIGHARHLDLAITLPKMELSAVASNEMWEEIYDTIAEFTKENRSTLIFVNTRRLSERVAHHLTLRLGEETVAAHHGSLSRKLRLEAETKLKQGELKALVATASLELGIDIGSIDLVCQIGSPRAIATALQRVGRAGHWRGAISKGRFFATTRDELLECAALINAIAEGDLDQLIIPVEPIDILAQQIVAACSTQDWQEEALFHLVKRAYPYKNLSQDSFDSVLEMLSDGIAGSRGRYGVYLFRDKVNGLIKGRRNARLTAITSGGAIPDNGLFTVIAEPSQSVVGTLDEDFAIESNWGDIILLGTSSWKIQRIESRSGRVIVEDAHGAPPSVPFWQGEAPARTNELSLHVSQLRQKIVALLSQNQTDLTKANHWLQENCGLPAAGAHQLIEYISQGIAILGAVPTQKTIIAERFFDEAGGMQLVIHAPFGARINKAWGMALRKRFCRSFNFELQAAATDDGLNISLAEQHSFPLLDVFAFLHPNTIKEVLIQAILQSPLFNIRWRWTATRSLTLVRFRNGRKVPPNIQRMLADDLLAAVFPDAAACQDNLGGRDIELPNHPLIDETMKDALTAALDIEGLIDVLKNILSGEIQCLAVDTPLPSVFSHEILNANPYAFLDDAPLEERRARAVEMRRFLPSTILEEIGKLDPVIINEVQQQALSDIRNADELHDLMQTLICLPSDLALIDREISLSLWQPFLEELIKGNRIGKVFLQDKAWWFPAEKAKTFAAAYPNALLQTEVLDCELKSFDHEEAILTLVRGWMLHLGPTTAKELSTLLAIDIAEIESALLKLETTGLILRGSFRSPKRLDIEWCERRLLARIHHLTVAKLRKEIEPVSPQAFFHWLLKWQHLAQGTQLNGEQGLIEIIRQLQGFEIPANAWEKQILMKRLSDYEPSMIDHLCLTGRIGWGRISSLNAKKSVMPRSVAPITFFIREESDWMSHQQKLSDEEALQNLSHPAKDITRYLQQRGASFFPDIIRGTGRLQAEVETGLWELVAAGVITADGFDNLRALIDPKRRQDKRRRRYQLRYHSGRWSLLFTDNALEPSKQLEAVCWMLLKRYGVVFRDLIAREKNIPRWRELLITFRRLEDRGEIRGGRFIKDFIGEQFALPTAIESLRAMKRQPLPTEIVTLSATDPLNLVGIILPGSRVSVMGGKDIVIKPNDVS